jgi:hypothetical protein
MFKAGTLMGRFHDKIAAAIATAKNRDAIYNAAVASGATPAQAETLIGNASQAIPTQTFTPGMVYGDFTPLPVVFAAAGSQLVLPRPKNIRVYLLIVNTLAANPINFNFGAAADNTLYPIPAGGNYIADTSVPQNDLYIFSPVAGQILVGYINNG